MPLSDRDGLIALLDRLGNPDDAVALAAAREIDARLKRDGLSWDAVLARPAAANDDNDRDDESPGHVHASDAEAAPVPIGDTAGDLAAIDRLLANKDLSADTREILTDLKEDIRSGDFAEADRRYVRSLEIRLGAAKRK
jgi:hypothetical protein